MFRKLLKLNVGLCAFFSLLGTAFIPEQAFAQFNYRGLNTTILRSPNEFGALGPQRVFRTNTNVTISSPIQVFDRFTNTVSTESNPFNLSLGPITTQDALATGSLTIVSATSTRASQFPSALGDSFLQQFWNLEYFPQNRSFRGVFTNPSGNLANQPNILSAPFSLGSGLDLGNFPFTLAVGTRLNGRFTQDFSQISIQVNGNTADRSRPFVTDIRANFFVPRRTFTARAASGASVTEIIDMPADKVSVPEPQMLFGLSVIFITMILGSCKTLAHENSREMGVEQPLQKG